MHNQKKDNNQFKNNKQPELPENETGMNSDNQGVIETFIQTCRRGGNRQLGEQRIYVARQQMMQVRLGLVDQETKDSKPLAIKHCGGCKKAGETHSLTGAFGV